MKILVSNSKNKHLLAPQIVNELFLNGHHVISSFYTDVTLKFAKFKLGRAILNFFPFIPHTISNTILLVDYLKKKPEIIVIFKGMEIFPIVLKLFKNRGVFLVNYNLDHPFNFVSKASGNKNILLNNPIYHLHLTYSKQIQKELLNKYPKKKVEYLPFGYHSYVDKLKLNGESNNTTCFIGQADDERAELISYLVNNDIEVHLYGIGWNKYFKNNPKVTVCSAVSGKEYWYTLNKYRIQLNLLRAHNYSSHNMRTFEIPAAESIMVSNRTIEQCNFFTDKKEAFYFKSKKELIFILKNIIKLSPEKAAKIRNSAKKKSFGNSYRERAKHFYTIIRKEYELFNSNISTFDYSKGS